MAVPMWRQIADDLRLKIESGELGRDGAPLPTEMELQDLYSASRNTVRDAVKLLVARGLVYTRSGQGTFVRSKIDPFVTTFSADPLSATAETNAFEVAVRDRSRKPLVSAPRVEIKQAADLAAIPARELKLTGDTSVLSRHQERRIDGVPYSLQTTFYPMSLVDEGATRLITAKDISEGAVSYIEKTVGIKQAGWSDRITVRVPDANETAFFSLPDDGRVAVFEIVRTGFDESGRPFRVTITTYPADRNEFVMGYGAIPDDPTPADETGNVESGEAQR